MRFMHLGDLHIGRTIGEFSLYEDQEYIFKSILEIIREKSVDAVLIAGDVYDKAAPAEAAVSLLDDFISSLADSGVETFIISGNHDSENRLGYGSRLFRSRGIHIAPGYDGSLSKYELEDEYGTVNVYLLPFVKASQVRYYHPEEEIKTYDDAVRTILKRAEIDWDSRNVIAAHQFVAGGSGKSDPLLAGSEGPSVRNVGTIEVISSDSIKSFDYAALGHLHTPQSVGYDHIRYSGSPLKYSLSEAGSDKSVPVITVREKGDVEIELVPLKPLRDLRHITGRLRQLLSSENVTDPDDYMYVTLTDEDVINDAMAIVQQTYPNTIKIDYRNSHTLETEEFDISEAVDNKPFDELISDFYSMMYGCGISSEELAVMMSAAREAGVVDEAD